MISNHWLQKRKPHWERLDKLVVRSRRGLRGFSGAELRELGLLYRQAASDLSTVRNDRSSPQLASYLNELLGKCHNLLYLGQEAGPNAVFAFYRDAFPRLFRETIRTTALAVAILLAGAIFGWLLTLHNPSFAHKFLGPQMTETIEKRQMWTESVVAIKPVAASAITTNNLSVSFAAFAFGITGVGTIWMMLFNGLLLGVIGAATWQAGMALSLWSFVAPHGALELPAICIAGGAGLELARGLFFPGFLRRKDSLSRAGARAVKLLMGVIPLLLIAGTIEGFFSPSHAPVALKFTLGAALFTLLLVYLFGMPLRRGAKSDSDL